MNLRIYLKDKKSMSTETWLDILEFVEVLDTIEEMEETENA